MAWVVAISGRQNIEMESPVDRRAVASREFERSLGFVAPARQNAVIEATRQQARRRGRAEDDARTLACRAGDFSPQLIQLLIRHPVLRVEQDVAVDRLVWLALEVFGERAIEDADPVRTRPYGLEMRLFQIGGQRAGRA